jgi:hypothetical protein
VKAVSTPRHLASTVGVLGTVRNSCAKGQNACKLRKLSFVDAISRNKSRRTDRALAYQKDLRARLRRLYS